MPVYVKMSCINASQWQKGQKYLTWMPVYVRYDKNPPLASMPLYVGWYRDTSMKISLRENLQSILHQCQSMSEVTKGVFHQCQSMSEEIGIPCTDASLRQMWWEFPCINASLHRMWQEYLHEGRSTWEFTEHLASMPVYVRSYKSVLHQCQSMSEVIPQMWHKNLASMPFYVRRGKSTLHGCQSTPGYKESLPLMPVYAIGDRNTLHEGQSTSNVVRAPCINASLCQTLQRASCISVGLVSDVARVPCINASLCLMWQECLSPVLVYVKSDRSTLH